MMLCKNDIPPFLFVRIDLIPLSHRPHLSFSLWIIQWHCPSPVQLLVLCAHCCVVQSVVVPWYRAHLHLYYNKHYFIPVCF